ncbi:nitroreductase/quinone reductase family protein [Prauserella oleivorans]|uniref:Nitroreductase/quinone reductase family protein n=1 Tax=Prauserella oleivorans TaxID=1478153 RepID=A0ABW5WED2_9PSEU
MAFPARLARFNRAVTNRFARPVAGRVPGLANVVHTGRTSGRIYRTPVNAFRTGDGYVIPLPYGTRTDWVRNVLASGGCRLETRGRTVPLRTPRIVHDERPSVVPEPIRSGLGLLGATDVLYLSEDHPGQT